MCCVFLIAFLLSWRFGIRVVCRATCAALTDTSKQWMSGLQLRDEAGIAEVGAMAAFHYLILLFCCAVVFFRSHVRLNLQIQSGKKSEGKEMIQPNLIWLHHRVGGIFRSSEL